MAVVRPLGTLICASWPHGPRLCSCQVAPSRSLVRVKEVGRYARARTGIGCDPDRKIMPCPNPPSSCNSAPGVASTTAPFLSAMKHTPASATAMMPSKRSVSLSLTRRSLRRTTQTNRPCRTGIRTGAYHTIGRREAGPACRYRVFQGRSCLTSMGPRSISTWTWNLPVKSLGTRHEYRQAPPQPYWKSPWVITWPASLTMRNRGADSVVPFFVTAGRYCSPA